MIKGLNILTVTSDRSSWIIASYHSPHSLTWRWLIGFTRFRGDEARVRPLWWTHKTSGGRQWGFRVPWLGIVRFSQQRPMWYRDCYNRLRDKQDGLLPSEDRPLPHQITPTHVVIDGGTSRH